MKIYCQECGAVLKTEKCKKCGADNRIYYRVEKYSKPSPCWPIIVLPIIFFVAVLASCVSRVVYPEAWSAEAYEDKQAAIEYVKTTYPEAEFIKGIYETMEFRPGASKPDNRFIFENDGLRFQVSVGEGKIVADGYWSSYAEHQFYNAYIKPFVEPRNITAEFSYIEYSLADFFENNPDADISQFDGDISFRILLFNDERSENPETLGWLYDFYCHCKENITIPRYSVTIFCKKNNTLKFTHETEFKNEADFYNSFD